VAYVHIILLPRAIYKANVFTKIDKEQNTDFFFKKEKFSRSKISLFCEARGSIEKEKLGIPPSRVF